MGDNAAADASTTTEAAAESAEYDELTVEAAELVGVNPAAVLRAKESVVDGSRQITVRLDTGHTTTVDVKARLESIKVQKAAEAKAKKGKK